MQLQYGAREPRQILKAAGLEQRLVELAPLKIVHLGERRVADDLLDAAAQLGGRDWQSLDRGEILKRPPRRG
jgi:hypothetical protein